MLQIPAVMNAAQLVKTNEPYEIRQVAVPQITLPTDVLIKVAVASFCHTDLMTLHGGFSGKLPMTGSHEPTGTIVALGSKAAVDFTLGDRVAALLWYNPCGSCEDCTGPEMSRQYCANMGGYIGTSIDGAFQEYLIVDSRFTVKIPDSMDFLTAAPLTCAGATVWRALKVSKAQAGTNLGIMGSGGGLGHILVHLAKAKGIRVIALDARDAGLKLTEEAGADVIIDVRRSNYVEQVFKETGGKGVDVTITVSDAAKAAASAFAITKRHGMVVQVAQPENIVVPFLDVIQRDIKLIGSCLSSQGDLGELLHFVVKRQIPVEVRPYHGLRSLPAVLQDADAGTFAGKLAVVVDENLK